MQWQNGAATTKCHVQRPAQRRPQHDHAQQPHGVSAWPSNDRACCSRNTIRQPAGLHYPATHVAAINAENTMLTVLSFRQVQLFVHWQPAARAARTGQPSGSKLHISAATTRQSETHTALVTAIPRHTQSAAQRTACTQALYALPANMLLLARAGLGSYWHSSCCCACPKLHAQPASTVRLPRPVRNPSHLPAPPAT